MLIREPDHFEWIVMADPGTAVSPFAVGFYAVDKYSPFLFMLDEIYETEPDLTTPGIICPQIKKLCDKWLGPGSSSDNTRWKKYYDSAAAWFAAAARKEHSMHFTAVVKKQGDKETGLQTIQELFFQRRFIISQNCPNAIWEFDNYYKDKKGNFIKKNDNHIDNTRYLINLTSLIVIPRDAPAGTAAAMRKKKRKKLISIDEDLKAEQKGSWQQRIFSRYEK